MITATNPITGEVFEIKDGTPDELEQAYTLIKSFEKTTKRLNDAWKKRIDDLTKVADRIDTPNGYIKKLYIQRQTYDVGVLRNLIDEDTLNDFLVIKKAAVDSWLKERVEKQDIDMELNHKIAKALIPDGKPYVTIKYEKAKL